MPTRPEAGVGLQLDELGGLAAHLEDGGHVGVQRAHGAGDGLELVLVGESEQVPDQTAAGAGDARGGDETLGQRGHDLVEQRLGGLGRGALDAAVLGHQDRRRTGVRSDPPVGGGIVKQLRRCRYLGEDIPFFRAADEGDLHAYAADVNPERSHDLLKSPPQ